MRGEIRAHAHMHGRTRGAAIPQSLTSATFTAGGEVVCRADATFVLLPPPPGAKLGPLPWQRQDIANVPLPKARDLDPAERAALNACNTALRRVNDRTSFIEHFWSAIPTPTAAGARCTARLGVQHTNRVGHVQGGLLFGLAAITASAAVPKHPQLSAVASWFISPGQGRSLKIVSRRVHEGRSFAAVHTEVKNTDGALVLEVVSHHAA
jgi:acyl-coenzyme A thioesterase PaaI-like protein